MDWREGAGLVPMLLWTEWVSWGRNVPFVFPPGGSVRMGQDGGRSCLSVWHPDLGVDSYFFWGGEGSLKLLKPWVRPEREKVDLLPSGQ